MVGGYRPLLNAAWEDPLDREECVGTTEYHSNHRATDQTSEELEGEGTFEGYAGN